MLLTPLLLADAAHVIFDDAFSLLIAAALFRWMLYFAIALPAFFIFFFATLIFTPIRHCHYYAILLPPCQHFYIQAFSLTCCCYAMLRYAATLFAIAYFYFLFRC